MQINLEKLDKQEYKVKSSIGKLNIFVSVDNVSEALCFDAFVEVENSLKKYTKEEIYNALLNSADFTDDQKRYLKEIKNKREELIILITETLYHCFIKQFSNKRMENDAK